MEKKPKFLCTYMKIAKMLTKDPFYLAYRSEVITPIKIKFSNH